MRSLEDLRTAQCWVFDLDNTLYPPHCNLFPQVERRMTQFIMERLSLDVIAARVLQKRYFHDYGTTLRGLMECHGVVAKDFLDFVHDIDYSILSYDGGLDAVLGSLPGRKIIFTNGSVSHAENVLQRLSIGGHFDLIFDIEAAGYMPKPHASGYDILFRKLSEDESGERWGGISLAVMVEDIAKNLRYPHGRGMMTLWVENDHEFSVPECDGDYIDFRTDDLVKFLRDDVMAGGQ